MTWQEILPRFGDSDAALADAALPMDNEAFAGFYERSARPLWAYLARVSGNGALADDLMQESFVRFLCSAQMARGEVDCRRYLFRVATNLMRDHWRQAKTASIEDVAEEVFAVKDGSAQVEALTMLGPAMAQMRPRDRQILWLAHAEGYSHREIAEITGLGAASVRLLLFRARRRMAELLREGSSGRAR